MPVILLTTDDAEEVAALEQQCFSTPWTAEQFRQAFEQDTFFLWGIRDAEHEGIRLEKSKLLAYLAVYCVAGELEVLNIAVHPEVRRKSLGRTLLDTVLQNAAKTGISRALLEVRRSNTPAIGLYEALGFEALGIRRHYYQDTNEDAIIYGRELVYAF
ncbi:MAG: ribosomal protein S18-alanine N-acetyltransferase [Pseudomonadota bacterium]